MFSTRTNQENAVYQQQQATAAKNHGVNNLAPKTPGYKAPKTPFKVTLNDENVTLGAGKTGGKGKGLFGDGKDGKVDPSAFVTPAGTHAIVDNITDLKQANTQCRTSQQSTSRKQDDKCENQRLPDSSRTTHSRAAISEANKPSLAQIKSQGPPIRARNA